MKDRRTGGLTDQRTGKAWRTREQEDSSTAAQQHSSTGGQEDRRTRRQDRRTAGLAWRTKGQKERAARLQDCKTGGSEEETTVVLVLNGECLRRRLQNPGSLAERAWSRIGDWMTTDEESEIVTEKPSSRSHARFLKRRDLEHRSMRFHIHIISISTV